MATRSSTPDLVREALGEAQQLVRLEVELAKDEVKHEVREAEGAAIGFGLAALLGVVALALFATAIVLALGGTAGAAIVVAACFLGAAAIAALVAFWLVPKKPLERTRAHARRDVKQLEEHAR